MNKLKFLKVRDHKTLVRESGSKAILNESSSDLNKYREQRALALKINDVVSKQPEVESRLDNIEKTLEAILELLKKE